MVINEILPLPPKHVECWSPAGSVLPQLNNIHLGGVNEVVVVVPNLWDRTPVGQKVQNSSCFLLKIEASGDWLVHLVSWAEIERRSMTSHHHGSTISGWQQNQWWWWRKKKGKKVKGFYWQNNKFTHASRNFVHFFAVVARKFCQHLPN